MTAKSTKIRHAVHEEEIEEQDEEENLTTIDEDSVRNEIISRIK